MNDFFDNYSWTIISIIGGLIGISMIFSQLLEENGIYQIFIHEILKGLM